MTKFQSDLPGSLIPLWVARLPEDSVASPSKRFMETIKRLRSICAEAEAEILASEALATELLGVRLMPV